MISKDTLSSSEAIFEESGEKIVDKKVILSKIKKVILDELIEWIEAIPNYFNEEELIDSIADEFLKNENETEETYLLEKYARVYMSGWKISYATEMVKQSFCKYGKNGDYEKGMKNFFELFFINHKNYDYLINNCPIFLELTNKMLYEFKVIFEKSRKAESIHSGVGKFRMGLLHASTFGLTALASIALSVYKNKSIENIANDPVFHQDLFFLKESHMITFA